MDISLMIEDIKFNYRVAVVIKSNDRVLVEGNNKVDFFVIPGGRVKIYEDTKTALKRELKEEMDYDIDIKDIKFVKLIENFFTYNNVKTHELYVLYELNSFNENLIDYIDHDSESGYYKWVDVKDINNTNILPSILKETILNLTNNE